MQDFSRDHLFALRLAHHIYQANQGFQMAPTLEEAGAALVKSWNDDLVWHFREEEEVILPVLSRHMEPSAHPDIRRMLDDHAWLRNALGLLGQHKDGSPSHLDRDLLVATGQRLHDHVRLEERRIYPILQEMLTAEELEEIRRGSEAFRRRWRSEDVIGPFRTHG